MTVYRVNDIYTTVQGEGCQTGTAMVLLRLQGCGVGCPWCDTKETWESNPKNARPSIAEAMGANVLYAVTEPRTIAQYIATQCAGPRWVLITGGEPAEQPLGPLVEELQDRGYRVAVETSGTAIGVIGAGADWVTVSPKINMPGKRRVLREVVEIADEIKFVVGKPADLETLDYMLLDMPTKPECQIVLQPLSQQMKATHLCLDTVIARGWRLSVQTHKYLNLP